jgi:23S rRNA (cytosine1962-C5)-methyltransferase
MADRLREIVPMLVEMFRPQGVLLRTEANIVRAEGFSLTAGLVPLVEQGLAKADMPTPNLLCPPPGASPAQGGSAALVWGRLPTEAVEICDGGLRFAVDLLHGQKTGFYLDQRENRRAAAGYLRGRRVLDVFCYGGGFGLTAAAAGATEVLGVDASAKAVAEAVANARRNGLENARFESGDAFSTLQSLAAAGERFGGVVLDPPKFARNRQGVGDALQAYARLNRLALGVLEPRGVLVTCSCSGHVTREDFLRMLLQVARQSGRDIQILEQRGAAADHPVAVTCPETEYLKCFVCRVG